MPQSDDVSLCSLLLSEATFGKFYEQKNQRGGRRVQSTPYGFSPEELLRLLTLFLYLDLPQAGVINRSKTVYKYFQNEMTIEKDVPKRLFL